jgi:hypothetical protein
VQLALFAREAVRGIDAGEALTVTGADLYRMS